jgi:hypothetical protein
MAAAGLTEPRGASERGFAMGGGHPAERRFTVGGSAKSVARCHRTVLAYWKLESISLQRRVSKLSVPFASSPFKRERLFREVALRGVDHLQIMHETIASRQSSTTGSLGDRCPGADGGV